MLIVLASLVTLLVSVWALSAGLRHLHTEIGALRQRVTRLVRLSVAVDDLRHETSQVVPAYRRAAGRAKAWRRSEEPEAPR